MSRPLAIAAVTAVLKNFLENSLTDISTPLGGNVTVSTEPPDRIDTAAPSPDRINLFLFQATENTGWRNYGLPTRNGNGERISNPPLALDLSYLLTAYGSGPLHAEALLGYAMFVMHEMPVLTRNAIGALTLAPADAPLLAGLKASELVDQIEQIKIAPQTMSVEELSKIWSALLTQYRPTAVYKASVVLIESEKSVKPTLPVRVRNFAVEPFLRPVIDLLQSQSAAAAPIVEKQPILAGYNLVIDGQQLRTETTRVRIDDETEIIPDDDKISGTRIIIPLPAGLQPGLHSVQVVQLTNFGTADDPINRRGVESNVAAFVLSPRIVTSPPSAAREGNLALKIDPAVGSAQRVTFLVGSGSIPVPARAAGNPITDLDVTVPSNFATGEDQLLRVQIDGAESPLEVDTAGKFVGPTIKIE